MQKHAYLIMAHNNFYILDKLLRLLDDPRNDIYLHIDKKVKNFDFDGFRTICKHAVVYYPKKRINVQWGTQSQVLTEMLLFKTAYSNGAYHYYHLISGVDLPLKKQDEIHDFFADKTESYMFYREIPSKWDYYRVSRYHNVFGTKGRIPNKLNSYLDTLQEWLGVDRLKGSGIAIKRGFNWASLSQKAVEALLKSESQIRYLSRFSVCADELYKQTLLVARGDIDLQNNDLRFVDWSAGGNHPHVFTIDDYDRLIASEKLFARKFDERTDYEVVNKLFDHIMSQQKAEKE